jgi:hypothetical protein
MKYRELRFFIRRSAMDHELIVGQLMDRGKHFIKNILDAPNLHSVAVALLIIWVGLREMVWELCQA